MKKETTLAVLLIALVAVVAVQSVQLAGLGLAIGQKAVSGPLSASGPIQTASAPAPSPAQSAPVMVGGC